MIYRQVAEPQEVPHTANIALTLLPIITLRLSTPISCAKCQKIFQHKGGVVDMVVVVQMKDGVRVFTVRIVIVLVK